MKLTNTKLKISALALILTTSLFIACSNGSNDSSSQKKDATQPVATEKVSTSGTITEDSIGTTDSGSITVKADSTGAYYEFISQAKSKSSTSSNIRSASAAENKGGLWKFYEGNNSKPKYIGTYKGDTSDFAKILVSIQTDITAGSLKLELTVTATADESGTLFEVSETEAFDFEIKTETNSEGESTFTFAAEIPAVTATETTTEEPAESNITINTLTGTYAGIVAVNGATSKDSVTIDGNNYVWKKDAGDKYIYWRGTVFNKVSDELFIFTNSERAEPEGTAEPTESQWKSDLNDNFILYAAYNATEDTISFVSMEGYDYKTEEWGSQEIPDTTFKKAK